MSVYAINVVGEFCLQGAAAEGPCSDAGHRGVALMALCADRGTVLINQQDEDNAQWTETNVTQR